VPRQRNGCWLVGWQCDSEGNGSDFVTASVVLAATTDQTGFRDRSDARRCAAGHRVGEQLRIDPIRKPKQG
jgi:hypothetical protein